MARRRKTKDERLAEKAEVEQQAWEAFRPRLNAVQSLREGWELVGQAPMQSHPARKYYMNLDHFLRYFTTPGSSTYSEKVAYVELIQRLEVAGDLEPAKRQQVEEELGREMRDQGP